MTKEPVRVLVAEDHPGVRAGICALVQLHGAVRVVAEARDGQEALALIEKHLPDVVLLDISMPRLDGIQVAQQVRERFPDVRVIVLSLHSDAQHVQRAVRAGAAGYLVKDLAGEIEQAVKTVAAGKTFFSAAVSQFIGQWRAGTAGMAGRRRGSARF